jgi:hypothetical protein
MNRPPDLAHHKEERNRKKTRCKNRFFIEIQGDFNQTTEVTVLPHSFNYWNEKLVHVTLSILGDAK